MVEVGEKVRVVLGIRMWELEKEHTGRRNNPKHKFQRSF